MVVEVGQINFSIPASRILCYNFHFFIHYELLIFVAHVEDVLDKLDMYGGVFFLNQVRVSV